MVQPGVDVRQRWFHSLGDLAYLDTATKGVPPSCTGAELAEATSQWLAGVADHSRWETAAEEARGMFATLVGMNREDVALLPSHVTAASVVARAWPSARVAIPQREYRGNLLPWISGRQNLRIVPSPATTARLCEAVDNGAEIVAVSNIQSADGLRIDLAKLVEHAHSRQSLVFVDASQSLGVDARLAESGADFIAAVGYKWILGGRGTAFLAIQPHQQAGIAPLLLAPESAADIREGVAYGPNYHLWNSARRLDQPQAWLPWLATAASLRLLSSLTMKEVDLHATRLAQQFSDAVQRLGFELAPAEVSSPMVAVAHPQPSSGVERLYAAGVRAAARDTSIRFAFHLYNTEEDLERAINALKRDPYAPKRYDSGL